MNLGIVFQRNIPLSKEDRIIVSFYLFFPHSFKRLRYNLIGTGARHFFLGFFIIWVGERPGGGHYVAPRIKGSSIRKNVCTLKDRGDL